VPILERTARQAAAVFRDHLAKLIANTLTTRHPVHHVDGRDGTWLIQFRQGELPTTIPIKTLHGTLHFFISQALDTVPDAGQERLQTLNYAYRLQNRPGANEPAVLRWEYVRQAALPYCRHHLHSSGSIKLGATNLSLEEVHVPTGWVTIEEVIRFLIYELGVRPPCGETWPKVLAESEKLFYEQFTSKRYRSHTAKSKT
jgi:hypothetical protein